MKTREMFYLFSRYLILLIFALFNLYIIYLVFTPLTLILVSGGLNAFYTATLIKGTSTIFVSGDYIELIPACIAGAAYYLLLVLNLSTPMKAKTRAYSLAFLIISFLFLNVIRIVVFTHLSLIGYKYFDTTHELFWYFGSTILLLLLWFANVFLFRITQIPIYSDVFNIIKDIRSKK
ncbi:pacearchaeosortase [Candidatus Pacearchaeota archaeon]|nr:pacearchaeosortase [Candidatus Pacearchaeota archaeon]